MRDLERTAGRRRKRRKSFFLIPTDVPGDCSDSPRGRAAERNPESFQVKMKKKSKK